MSERLARLHELCLAHRYRRGCEAMMSVLDLRALLSALDERGVGFVAIGGVAVGAHGYVRATQNLGLVRSPLPRMLRASRRPWRRSIRAAHGG